ncbi:MAG: PatB family C-S lyase [Bacteroidia bacterium]|nr:PatB family C-S lyase [Bacteroidia bacterium]
MYNFDELIDRSGSHSVKYDLREQIFGTDDLIPMWVADMDFRTPPFITEAIGKRLKHEIFGYSVRSSGFNESVIQWLQSRHQWITENDWITYSPGVVPALSMLVLALTSPGDKIIIQPPVYHPFKHVITNNDRLPLLNRLIYSEGRYSIDFDDLKKKAGSGAKLLILCNPHNPVGRVWKNDELNEIARICIENNVLVVSDEIHCDLVFPGNRHIPFASISPEASEISVTTISTSKTFNIAGLHTSAIIIPDAGMRGKYNAVLDTLHVGYGNIFGNIAMETAYKYGSDWVDELVEYLYKNVRLASSFIKQNIPEILVIEPEATYLMWLDFQNLGMNDKDLVNFLVTKAKLGFNDGCIFGPGGSGFQRLNFGCPLSVLMQALERLRNAII